MTEDRENDAAYDLAPEPPPRPPPPPPAVTGPGVAPRPLAYRAPKDEAPAAADPETIKNLHMPLWLLGGGVAVEVAAAWLKKRSLEYVFVHVGVDLIVGTILMLVGILIAAKYRGIDLGRFWTAVFKLAAISVAPSAVLTLASPVLGWIPFGMLLGWLAAFVLYFALLGALFDLDESDTWYCVCVIFLVRLALYFTLLAYTTKWA